MLVIREKQMKELDDVMESRFAEKLSAHVKKCFPEQTSRISEDVLIRRIESAAGSAKTYGLSWQSNMAAFVSLTFAVGPGFHKHPSISAWLSSKKAQLDTEFGDIAHAFDDEVWRAAASEEGNDRERIERIENVGIQD